jgi:hypothetical protein
MQHPLVTRWHLAWLVTAALALAAQASTVKWSIKIAPSGGGQVNYTVSSPAQSGTLTASGKLEFNEGALIDLTFVPAEGYRISLVMKNLDNITGWLDGSNHYRFGPVSSPHVISVVYQLINPTGEVPLPFPADPPVGTAPVYDGTGHYSGKSPTKYEREYDFDVAMDESGKVEGMGTVEGITANETPGNAILVAGKVKTVKNEPIATLSASGSGMYDGIEVAGKGSASGSLVELDEAVSTAADVPLLNGAGSYSGKKGGVPAKGKNLPVAIPASPDASRAWSLLLSLEERQVTVRNKTATKLYAQADLLLPNGDTVRYAEREVKYTARSGFNLKFKGGQNLTANVPDKKSSVQIKKLLMRKEGAEWVVVDGQIAYAFLGQKGKGNLADFAE